MADPGVGVLMFVAHRCMEQRIFEAVREAGFEGTLAQGRFFARIGPQGNRLTELAEMAQVTKQTAGFLVDQLEKHGYVERVPDPTDARARLIRISERGRLGQERARVTEQAGGGRMDPPPGRGRDGATPQNHDQTARDHRPVRRVRQGVHQAAPARKRRSSGPAVREPDSPSLTKTATARSPWAAIIQAWVLQRVAGPVLRGPGLGDHRGPVQPAEHPTAALGDHRAHHLPQLVRPRPSVSGLPVGFGRCALHQVRHDGLARRAPRRRPRPWPAATPRTLPWPIIAAARPVAVGSSGTDAEEGGKADVVVDAQPQRSGGVGQIGALQLAALADERGVAGLGQRRLQGDRARSAPLGIVAVVLELLGRPR